MLLLNEQNDPKPQHQLTSELEAANVSRGEKPLLSSEEKLPQFPARYWRWLKIVWKFGDAARRFSMRGFQRFGCNDVAQWVNPSISSPHFSVLSSTSGSMLYYENEKNKRLQKQNTFFSSLLVKQHSENEKWLTYPLDPPLKGKIRRFGREKCWQRFFCRLDSCSNISSWQKFKLLIW